MRYSEKDVILVRDSGLFDEAWYVSEYPDVSMVGIEPAQHYLEFGEKLLRSPGPHFDTRQYLRHHPEVQEMGSSPLLHHLDRLAAQASDVEISLPHALSGYLDLLDETRIGGWAVDASVPGAPVDLVVFCNGERIAEIRTSDRRNDLIAKGIDGRHAGFTLNVSRGLFREGMVLDIRFAATGESLSSSPRRVGKNDPSSLAVNPELFLQAWQEGRVPPVTVIVPVFNAHDAVSECLEALANHLPAWGRVLVIDDCSTDPRIPELLARYRDGHGFAVERNVSNLGYTRTVNKGIRLCGETDVVLLNSDTAVTDGWLSSLRYCAYARPAVATVTALSDNAGAFSVPEIAVANDCPSYLTREQYARVVRNAAAGRAPAVPTGNGFCMYITRHALARLGLFDEEKFPRGYGEENDFCMRAYRRGMLNLVCDKSFVFHKRSQSFQDEKKLLLEQGAKQLAIDYPEYRSLTSRYRDIEFSLMRGEIKKGLTSSSRTSLPRILFVISTQTGGTPQTNLDLMRSVSDKYECFLLRSDSRQVFLSKLVGRELVTVEAASLITPISPVLHTSAEYDAVVLGMLYRHSIALVHIRHIAWHGLGLASAAKALDIPVVYSVHDFYSICPTVNLIDGEQRYCAARCSGARGDCEPALWPKGSLPSLRGNFVHRWRQMFDAFLEHCDLFITTSPSAAKLFSSVFDGVESRLQVIPHGRDFDAAGEPCPVRLPYEGPVRVLVPGNIGVTKGSTLLMEMESLDERGEFEFHYLGAVSEELKSYGVHHGAYARSEFPSRVEAIRPSLGVVLSIWPETYCHTLSEMWASGVPVLGIDLGSVGDRIRASGAGWLVEPEADAAAILERLREIVRDRVAYADVVSKVRQWRSTEAIHNDTAAMASKYKRHYLNLLRGRSDKLRVALLVKGHSPSHPPTTHIRLLGPLQSAHAEDVLEVRTAGADWLLAGGLEQIDALVVQRDAVPANRVDELLSILEMDEVPFVYEIDDLLWALPEDHHDHSITPADVEAMLKLVRSADVVTTSTPYLRDRISTMAKRVELVPNTLAGQLWLCPLQTDYVAQVGKDAGLKAGVRRLLYMGTRSHAADLEAIDAAIAEVRALIPELEIIQIGGGHLLPGAKPISTPSEAKDYRGFVRWFRALAAHADVALAPLMETDFNLAKSDIKTLDYGLARIPAIYSNWGPYAAAVNHGVDGWLASGNTKGWVHGILSLLSNPELRRSIAEAAFARASRRHCGVSSRQWVDLFTDLTSGGRHSDYNAAALAISAYRASRQPLVSATGDLPPISTACVRRPERLV